MCEELKHHGPSECVAFLQMSCQKLILGFLCSFGPSMDKGIFIGDRLQYPASFLVKGSEDRPQNMHQPYTLRLSFEVD